MTALRYPGARMETEGFRWLCRIYFTKTFRSSELRDLKTGRISRLAAIGRFYHRDDVSRVHA